VEKCDILIEKFYYRVEMDDWSVSAMRGELRRLKMELSGISPGKLRRDQLEHEILVYKNAIEKKKELPEPPKKAKTGNKPPRDIPVNTVETNDVVLKVPTKPEKACAPTGGPVPRDYTKQVEAMRKARDAKKAMEEARNPVVHVPGCLCNKCVSKTK
jgi:hypothetical protein